MSEQHEALYDGDTPYDKLIRYRWTVTDLDIEGDDSDAETIYKNALVSLGSLLEAHGVSDARLRNVLMGQFVPGPFVGNVGGEGFDDWLRRLRLIPLRLLDHEIPPIEEYTDSYLCEVFATALHEDLSHGAACIFLGEGETCSSSSTCPARVAHEVGLRQLGILFFDLNAYEPDDTGNIERAQTAITNLSYRLKLYNLADDRTLDIVKSEMHVASADFFKAIRRPQHKKSD